MEQFNLEEYLDNPNKRVVTREGNDVRIICTDRICTYLNEDYPIVGLIRNRFGSSETITAFKSNGESVDKNLDLFFDPKEKERVCPFKKGDWVLVRDYDDERWRARIFNSYDKECKYECEGDEDKYIQCIPYNEHTRKLLGMTDEYKEE